jgi:diguanylate cyclase (GGDEF)-like protein
MQLFKKVLYWSRNKSILFKVLLTYVITILIIGFVGYSYYIFTNISSINRETKVYYDKLISDKKMFVSNIVNIAIKEIENNYKAFQNGEISEGLAKKLSINFINNIRYKNNDLNSYGYLWINTLNGTMIVDPPKPELNGKNVWDYKDKNGTYLFREMANVVKLNGEGFVHYCWAKIGDNNTKNCYPKISYVKYFPQWDWIIGSGFYIDEINSVISAYKERIKKDIVITISYSILFGLFATIIAGFIFFIIVYYITLNLKKIGEVSVKLTKEDISPNLKLKYKSNDEIGLLIHNFNQFIDESYYLINFKKTIEEDRDIDTVYSRIKNLLEEKFNIKEISIYEVNNSKNALKHIYSTDNKFFCKQEILTDIFLCRAVRTAKIINSEINKDICESFLTENKKNYICIPLIMGGVVAYVVQILFDEHGIDNDKLNRINKYLQEAAPVIELKRLFAQLKESTLKDPLTGLYNRRFLDESAEVFASTAIRRGTNLGVLMLDIDFFKKVNDIYGHNIGDRVLKVVSDIIRNSVRESDIVVRFGGEEFLVLLQDVSEESAVSVAEKIRKNIESKDISTSSGNIRKTISIGVAIFPTDTNNFWECVKYSDVALYKAKNSGRNKVVRFEKSMWEHDSY